MGGIHILLLWFCDVKFQNWLCASPVVCLPGGEKAMTGSGSGVSARGTLGVLLWCPSVWSVTWDPAPQRWLASQCPAEEHSVPS